MIQHPSVFAEAHPERAAIVMGDSGRVVTYAELDARSNQVAHLLRRSGLEVGSHFALLLENRVEFLEVMWGALRAGVYVTPINWHLNASEVAYVVNDCGASMLVGSAPLLRALEGETLAVPPGRRLAVGGTVAGTIDYEAALAGCPDTPIADECEGQFMFYSSGTTGRPKGIKPPTVGGPLGEGNSFTGLMGGLFGIGEDAVYLTPAPMYHAAPAGWTTGVHRLGGTAVIMERFDPRHTLALIEKHAVTHVQFVPTHMVRLLKLPEEDRTGFDLSSLRKVIHAAAPCPPDVKRACIDWWGPVVEEYYSGSEGAGFCYIGSEDWLAHPGSVGRSLLGVAHIVDEDGHELPTRAEGHVWFESPNRFEYHQDPAKTAAAFNERGWSSLGDVGWLDEEGFLYLTDRVSNMIISGGVNIYPREVEDVLVLHPAVGDVAVVGVVHPEMGETVRAVVQRADQASTEAARADQASTEAARADQASADGALAEELISLCRERLAHYKCPSTVAFVNTVPRLPTGKLAKRLLEEWVREPFADGQVWARA